MVPPVQSEVTGAFAVESVPSGWTVIDPPQVPLEFPVTAKLPDVFERKMPCVPPLAATLVSEMANGVVLLERVISTAVFPLGVTAPLATLLGFVLSVARSPR